ncbi:hypothetical protein Q3G72_018321 [Acer saccharum]|nr:hypothetical protein Q3G72_018321 [Acer saccharum]
MHDEEAWYEQRQKITLTKKSLNRSSCIGLPSSSFDPSQLITPPGECAGRQGRTRTGVQPERKTRIKERLKARLFAFLKRKADYARRGAQP